MASQSAQFDVGINAGVTTSDRSRADESEIAPSDQNHGEISWPIVWPLLVMLIASFVIREFDIDRRIAMLNYDSVNQFWPFERADPWLSFYRYGVFPPLLLGIAGAVIALFAPRIWQGKSSEQIVVIRKRGLFLFLLLVIGPGLLVNGGLKSVWGRPRPLQCQEFGGNLPFRHVGEWTAQSFPNSSFPSGHASIAFFLMGPCFIVSTHRAALRRFWLFTGITYGMLMGLTRVMQGGHFLSDVLWAGMIVYLTGVILARFLLGPSTANQGSDPSE